MRRFTLILVILCLFFANAKGETKKDDQEEKKIPTTLDEAHAELERLLPPEELAKIDKMESEDDMIMYHFGLGMWMRNNWGLWAGGELAKYMQKLGFTHPDDMSGAILSTFWCKRHNKDFRLEERAAKYKAYWDEARKADEEEKVRVKNAQSTIKGMMIGLKYQKQDDVSSVYMPDRTDDGLRARFLSGFREGVFITVRGFVDWDTNNFITGGFYFDPSDKMIHKIQVKEVSDIHSAIVVGKTAWFTGITDGKAVLAGINEKDRIIQPLPQERKPPQLGIDGESLLAVYPKSVYRLAEKNWEKIYTGEVTLPRSGPPPEIHGHMLFFRDEGRHESFKRLWWLTLTENPKLTSLDKDVGVVGSYGPRWENSYSYCVTKDGDLWSAVGGSINRKSLLRRSKDGKYSIAIFSNSVNSVFADEDSIFGARENDQGLSVTAVTELKDGTILLVGDQGLYRIKDKNLIQELAFENTNQKVPINEGKNVLHWNWEPSKILILDDSSYFISGAFGGIYILRKDDDGKFGFVSLDEKLGDPVAW